MIINFQKARELKSTFEQVWSDIIGALIYNVDAMIPDKVTDLTQSSLMENKSHQALDIHTYGREYNG